MTSRLAPLAFVCAAVGCDGGAARPDARPPVDAREPNLSCAGETYPDTVPDPIGYGGLVFEPGLTGASADEPVESAVIRARGLSGTPVLAFTSSEADGRYELSFDTGGEPVFAYFEVTHTLYLDTKVYLPTAVFEPRDDVDVPLFTQQHLDSALNFADVRLEPGQGLLVVRAYDCEGVPLEGATITTTPAPLTSLYLAQTGLPAYDLTATSSQGAALLFGLDASTVQVEGELGGLPLRFHSIVVGDASTGTITTAGIVP